MELDSVDKIIDFAISNEQKAAKFYDALAERMDLQSMKDVFIGFADEERGHEAKLKMVKAGNMLLSAEAKVLNLGLADNVKEANVDVKAMSFQEALVVAMNAEKAAFKLYTNLAESTDDPALKELLSGLAQEEAKHKLRFELEYDDQVMQEN